MITPRTSKKTLGAATNPNKANSRVRLEGHSVAQHPLISRLIALGFDLNDCVVFGSGPLLAHRIRDTIRDVDVVARENAWDRATKLGIPNKGSISGDTVMHFWGGRIQICHEWIFGQWNTDALIERATLIDGVLFAPLADVLAYKQILRRRKDIADIEILSQILGTATASGSS